MYDADIGYTHIKARRDTHPAILAKIRERKLIRNQAPVEKIDMFQYYDIDETAAVYAISP